MTLDTAVSPANVATSALYALEAAETAIMPCRCAHSRLYVAITCVEETRSFLQFPSEPGRVRLLSALEDVFRVETEGAALRNTRPLIRRGLALAITLAQGALLGDPGSADLVLEEIRQIAQIAERES